MTPSYRYRLPEVRRWGYVDDEAGLANYILWHVCQQRQPLLWNGSANTPVARQWLSSRHMMAAINTAINAGNDVFCTFIAEIIHRGPAAFKSAFFFIRLLLFFFFCNL
jgi:hypothetical protein